MELIENLDEFRRKFASWNGDESLGGYPFVENEHSPFAPARRALPMLNLGLRHSNRRIEHLLQVDRLDLGAVAKQMIESAGGQAQELAAK